MTSSPSNQAPLAKLPFSPNIISTPRSQVLGTQNINTGSNVKNSLNFTNSNVPGPLLNLTLNGLSGLINTEQPSFLGMLLGDQTLNTSNQPGLQLNLSGVPSVSNVSNQSGSELNVSGLSGLNNSTTQCQSHKNPIPQPAPVPTEYSKARIIKATSRDISLTLPNLPAHGSEECPCKRPKSSISTQYEDDPFLGRIYSKQECKTPGTEAFNQVSVS